MLKPCRNSTRLRRARWVLTASHTPRAKNDFIRRVVETATGLQYPRHWQWRLGLDGIGPHPRHRWCRTALGRRGPRTPLLPPQTVYLLAADLLTKPKPRVVQQLEGHSPYSGGNRLDYVWRARRGAARSAALGIRQRAAASSGSHERSLRPAVSVWRASSCSGRCNRLWPVLSPRKRRLTSGSDGI